MTAESARSVHKRTGSVAAIVLAAGEAQRMGSPKALLQWRGQSLLRHCASTALDSNCDKILVALGANARALEPEISDLAVESFEHEDWNSGMGSTLAAAMGQLSAGCTGVVVLLCDQPFVTPELINSLIEQAGAKDMAASEYGDTLGPPAFFAASQFERLRGLRGDRGAKALLVEDRDAVAFVPFPEGRFDIDKPEDYDGALAELARQAANESGK